MQVRVKCVSCEKEGTTKINDDACGVAALGSCSAICMYGLCFPCCLLGCQFAPFCVPALRDKVHHCEHCGAQVGKYKVVDMKKIMGGQKK